jgi:hypothetical protein
MQYMLSKLLIMFIGIAPIVQGCNVKMSSSIDSKDLKLQQSIHTQQQKSRFAEVLKGLKPKDGDSGLLLGFDTDTSQNSKSYAQFYDFKKPDFSKSATNKTLYLTRIGNQIKLAANLDYIASPQPQGFIYTGQVRYLEKPRFEYCGCPKCTYSKCLIGSDYSRIWVANYKPEVQAVRESKASEIKTIIDNEFEKLGLASQDVTDYEKISFIGEGFYVVEGFRSKIFGGAAWFNARTKNFLVPLLDGRITSYLKDLYTPKQIETAFGSRKQRRWSGGDDDVVDTATFTLSRLRGRTHVLGMIETDGNAHRTFHKPFDMGFALNKLVRYDNPPFEFDKFKSIYPTIIDLFISPNQNTIVILTKEEIIGLDVRSQKEIFKVKHNLLFNKVVMIEWATNSYVSKWQKELVN